MIKVLIYNEFYHEQEPNHKAGVIYPEGIHSAIAGFLNKEEDISADAVTLETVSTITPEALKNVDVMLWWGHCKHDDVPNEVAQTVQEAVLNGMGIIFLHSAHKSKPFMKLMGTDCSLTWRESDDMERIWVTAPYHPIAKGLDRYFELPGEETYGEPFGIPTPDEIVFMGWYTGGEVFRSGCTWQRGSGKVFYFQPGHETYPTYLNPTVQMIITNAVRWVKPDYRRDNCMDCPNTPPVHKF